MTQPSPDIFRNVHKGIRKALFDACLALGRAEDDAELDRAARALLGDALRFVAHHGENEDLLLLPLLEARAPAVAQAMSLAHRELETALHALEEARSSAPAHGLYLASCAFAARYLEHMREEEQAHEPLIRAALAPDELAGFGQRSVARTAPLDQRLMLGFMLPAMRPADASSFLARLPPELAGELRRALVV
jgi:hypothetical protein